jgi:hypothetical protein
VLGHGSTFDRSNSSLAQVEAQEHLKPRASDTRSWIRDGGIRDQGFESEFETSEISESETSESEILYGRGSIASYAHWWFNITSLEPARCAGLLIII